MGVIPPFIIYILRGIVNSEMRGFRAEFPETRIAFPGRPWYNQSSETDGRTAGKGYKMQKKLMLSIAALMLALSLILSGCTGGKHGDSDEDATRNTVQTDNSGAAVSYPDSAENAG